MHLCVSGFWKSEAQNCISAPVILTFWIKQSHLSFCEFSFEGRKPTLNEAPSRNIIAAVKRVAHQPKLIKPNTLWPGVRPVCTRRGAGAGGNPAFPRLVRTGNRWRQFVHRAALQIKCSFIFHPARSERFDLFLPFSIFNQRSASLLQSSRKQEKEPECWWHFLSWQAERQLSAAGVLTSMLVLRLGSVSEVTVVLWRLEKSHRLTGAMGSAPLEDSTHLWLSNKVTS